MDKILFIDDEIGIIESYLKIFKKTDNSEMDSILNFLDSSNFIKNENETSRRDFTLFSAHQGLEGIEIVKQQLLTDEPIKVVFIDMRMPPGIDGCETALRIREIDPRLEIVIVTAYSDLSLSQINDKIGHTDKLLYLKKPFTHEEVYQIAINLITKYNDSKTKDTFLSNISSQLNTPMQLILEYTKVLTDRNELQIRDKELVKNIETNILEIKNSLNNLVQIAEDNQKIDLLTRPSSLRDILEATNFNCLLNLTNKPSVKLNYRAISNDLNLNVDSDKIIYALNLISDNACKFTHDGEIKLFVNIQNENKGKNIEFHIIDTGIGIPETEVNKVFKKFYKAQNAKNTEGFGIGLTMAKRIFNAHGGDIQIISVPGHGTDVKASLKLA